MALRERGGKWHYRFKVDGRTYTGPTDFAATKRNQTKAKAAEYEHRKAIQEGRTWAPKLLVRLFSDAAPEFLEWAEVEHRAHPNTHKRLVTSFANLREYFGALPVGMIDPARIDQYKAWRFNEHSVRDITVRHDLHALSKFFKWAWKMNYARVGENPVDAVTVPSDADAVRIHVVTVEEERLYLQYAKGNLRDCALLMLNQGLRPDEVLSMRKAEVNLDRGDIQIPRGKFKAARRSLAMTGEARAILAGRMIGQSCWLFPSPQKPWVHLTKLNGAHDRVCEKTGLRFVLYDFRHTFATRMAQAGVDLATLAAILGHSSLRSVMKYVHPTAQHQQDAMARYEESRGELQPRDTLQ